MTYREQALEAQTGGSTNTGPHVGRRGPHVEQAQHSAGVVMHGIQVGKGKRKGNRAPAKQNSPHTTHYLRRPRAKRADEKAGRGGYHELQAAGEREWGCQGQRHNMDTWRGGGAEVEQQGQKHVTNTAKDNSMHKWQACVGAANTGPDQLHWQAHKGTPTHRY